MKCQTNECSNDGQEHWINEDDDPQGSTKMFLCAYHAIDFGEKVEDEEYLLAEIGFRECRADKLFKEMKREEQRAEVLKKELEMLRGRKKKDVHQGQDQKDH